MTNQHTQEHGGRILDATLALVSRLESTDSEKERLAAIRDLAGIRSRDAARALIDALDRSLWRDTRIALIRALGDVADERATMRLVRTASDTDDLVLAAEAMIALGTSGDLVAGEFLASVAGQPEHPLAKEALLALCNAGDFPCEREITSILSSPAAELPPTVLQYAVLAAGLQGVTAVRPAIHGILLAPVGDFPAAVANAALLSAGRIGDAETVHLLASLDHRYRFFANQLRETAVERIHLRLKLRIEDAVSGVLTARTPREMTESLRLAAGFDAIAVREAFSLLAPDADIIAQSRVRSFTATPTNLNDDTTFMKSNRDHLPIDELARLVRAHLLASNDHSINSIESSLGRDTMLSIASRCRFSETWIATLKLEMTAETPDRRCMLAVNALVNQFWMAPSASPARTAIQKILESAADDKTLIGPVANRIARAIGEIGLGSSKALRALSQRWKDGVTDSASVASALGLIASDDAAKILERRLDDLAGDEGRAASSERLPILRALGRCGELGDTSALAKLSPRVRNEARAELLAILGSNKVSGMTSWVAESLASGDFDTRLRAIVAAKHNHDASTWDSLFELLDHASTCLAGRALDSIAIGGSVPEHIRLLKWADVRESLPRHAAIKIARGLNLREGGDYREAIRLLDGLLARDSSPWNDAEVRQSLISTRDHLVTVSPPIAEASPKNASNLKASNVKAKVHAIDEELATEIPTFGQFSETVKSVLRNAELTWRHPELFDRNVDKSTVVVQYVKSLDILMQEHLGTAIFHAPTSPLPNKMHARLLQLHFDEPDIAPLQAIQTLQCGYLFTGESFPSVKFASICQSVLSGRLFRDQYRVIDGLRAWAVLILLFGRPFKHRGTAVEPLLPLKTKTGDQVDKIIRALHELQDMRNAAAHRGTLLGMVEIENVRSAAFQVFRGLQTLMG